MINIIVLNLVYQLIKLGHKKRTKETPKSPLFTRVIHGEPRARTQEEKSGEISPGLRERERERESTKLFGTTK